MQFQQLTHLTGRSSWKSNMAAKRSRTQSSWMEMFTGTLYSKSYHWTATKNKLATVASNWPMLIAATTAHVFRAEKNDSSGVS